jgi:hypothetical protein
MSHDKESVRQLMEKIDAFDDLKYAIKERMASFSSPEEEAEANSFIKRAFDPQCEFDRKHKVELIALAISPHALSWHFKVRERIHRLSWHH